MRRNCRSAENLVGNPPTGFIAFRSPFTVRRLAFGILISDFCILTSVLVVRSLAATEPNKDPQCRTHTPRPDQNKAFITQCGAEGPGALQVRTLPKDG